jgi:hypothetical protein
VLDEPDLNPLSGTVKPWYWIVQACSKHQHMPSNGSQSRYLARNREADLDRSAAVHGYVAETAVRVVRLRARTRKDEIGVDVVEGDELRPTATAVDVVHRRGAALADVAHNGRRVDRRPRRGTPERESVCLVLRKARRGCGNAVRELEDDNAVCGNVASGVPDEGESASQRRS